MESIGGFERLARSWSRHLRAENKSPKTLETYREAISQLVGTLSQEGVSEVGEREAGPLKR